jgi:nicotinamidase-related amidase
MMNKRALLVIDAQRIYDLPDSELCVDGAEEVLANINRLIHTFHNNNEDVIYVRHMHKADGSDSGRMWDFTGEEEKIGFLEGTEEVEYMEKLVRLSGSPEIIKHRYSALEGTNLLDHLNTSGVSRIVIAGFMTNFCCEATARHAHDKDFYVDFIEDATGCPDLENLTQKQLKEATCETLAAGYANIHTISEYLEP